MSRHLAQGTTPSSCCGRWAPPGRGPHPSDPEGPSCPTFKEKCATAHLEEEKTLLLFRFLFLCQAGCRCCCDFPGEQVAGLWVHARVRMMQDFKSLLFPGCSVLLAGPRPARTQSYRPAGWLVGLASLPQAPWGPLRAHPTPSPRPFCTQSHGRGGLCITEDETLSTLASGDRAVSAVSVFLGQMGCLRLTGPSSPRALVPELGEACSRLPGGRACCHSPLWVAPTTKVPYFEVHTLFL